MFGLALDAPQTPSAADLLRFFLVPAEVRSAGDPGSVSAENQLRALGTYRPALADGWLSETLGYVHTCRSYRAGWDGGNAVAPSAKALDAAEYLTAFFASWPVRRRPKLAIDFEGRPTFASKGGDFYLHLTVEGSDRLTWYATAGADEYFEENVAFDGTALPSTLAKLAV